MINHHITEERYTYARIEQLRTQFAMYNRSKSTYAQTRKKTIAQQIATLKGWASTAL